MYTVTPTENPLESTLPIPLLSVDDPEEDDLASEDDDWDDEVDDSEVDDDWDEDDDDWEEDPDDGFDEEDEEDDWDDDDGEDDWDDEPLLETRFRSLIEDPEEPRSRIPRAGPPPSRDRRTVRPGKRSTKEGLFGLRDEEDEGPD